ncbi:MAG: type IV pilin protein [Acidimicrobiia bacterium]
MGRSPKDKSDDRGLTLMELMMVVFVIGALLAIVTPLYLGARTRTRDAAAKELLDSALRVEFAYAADAGGFSADPGVLAAEEPAFDWTGATDETVHVVLATPDDLLPYTRSGSGTWFGISEVLVGASAGRYTCTGTAEADVDENWTGSNW